MAPRPQLTYDHVSAQAQTNLNNQLSNLQVAVMSKSEEYGTKEYKLTAL